ncbi:MAG: hypothetical protein LBP22_05580 [Deltaproteobacteria bacterium]|nr:hypothetical protein [Deltaproteobacteria bacterium]
MRSLYIRLTEKTEGRTLKAEPGSAAAESRRTYTGSQRGVPVAGLEHLVPQDVNPAERSADTDLHVQ